jgi:ankyrin repeat protein
MNRAYLPFAIALAVPGAPLAAQEPEQNAAQMPESYTFLQAVRNGDAAAIQSIVANPSSTAINTRDPRTGEGALHILVQRRDLRSLAFLLTRSARPDIQTGDGTTPLALAARLGWVEGAEQLLARGARVDLANRRGETPLILAVQARQLSAPERLAMISLLLGQGADPNRQDSYAGYSALDYARQDRRSPEILRALEAQPQRDAAAVGPNP